jgi:hypothetical protein
MRKAQFSCPHQTGTPIEVKDVVPLSYGSQRLEELHEFPKKIRVLEMKIEIRPVPQPIGVGVKHKTLKAESPFPLSESPGVSAGSRGQVEDLHPLSLLTHSRIPSSNPIRGAWRIRLILWMSPIKWRGLAFA